MHIPFEPYAANTASSGTPLFIDHPYILRGRNGTGCIDGTNIPDRTGWDRSATALSAGNRPGAPQTPPARRPL